MRLYPIIGVVLVLAGIFVLDLTRVLAGPYCTMLLADLGARVVKVEAPGRGDDARQIGPFVGGVSAYFLSLNRNKRSVVADLKTEEGVSLVRRLAVRARRGGHAGADDLARQ